MCYQIFIKFLFFLRGQKTVIKEIKNLEINKAVQDSHIPVNILKENAEFFTKQMRWQFIKAICSSMFLTPFKLANITPVFKVDSRNQKDDHRPNSILPVIAKTLENLILQQLLSHFENIFSKIQCGFRNGFGTHHCLLLMTEKRQQTVDNKKGFGALLTDLPKAF